MAEYAKVVDGVVVAVIVADEEFISGHPEGNLFIKTPYDEKTGEGKVGPGFDVILREEHEKNLAPTFRRKWDGKIQGDAVPSPGDAVPSPSSEVVK